jgi:hypothetical protein
MNHEDAKDIFCSESSWLGAKATFWAITKEAGISYGDDDWFGMIAAKLWDSFSFEKKEAYAAQYESFYAAAAR